MAAIGAGSAGTATPAITAAATAVAVTAEAGVMAAEAATENSVRAEPAILDVPQTPLLRFIPE
jgi:hypothetical protein